jgi:hypothetical protein
LARVSGDPVACEFKQWNSANATILKNVEDWRGQIASTTGYEPNIMVCSPDVLAALKVSSEVNDTIKYTQKGVVTETASIQSHSWVNGYLLSIVHLISYHYHMERSIYNYVP